MPSVPFRGQPEFQRFHRSTQFDPLNTTDIVAKLWNLCHVLRDDGITYQDYVNELSYLLFLKMMQETNQEPELPKGYRWADLESLDGANQLAFYRGMLGHLGTEGSDPVKGIFANANTSLTQPRNLAKLVQTHEHFQEFENCYGDDAGGRGSRRADHEDESQARFRCFTRDEIKTRGDNLDISWLKDDDGKGNAALPEPEEIASRIRERLSTALEEMDALVAILEGDHNELETNP